MNATERSLLTAGAPGPFLDQLEPRLRDRLLARAEESVIAPRGPIFLPTAAWTRAGVITTGIARATLASGDGRQLTIRYVRPGDVIGSVFPMAGSRAPLGISAVTECRFVEFDAEDFRHILETDAAAALLVVRVFNQRLEDLYATVAALSFGTMKERVAGHLLELAQVDEKTGVVSAPVTQQHLADSVGSVREVVARVLRELRQEGVVSTAHGAVEILDPSGLAALVSRWRQPPRL